LALAALTMVLLTPGTSGASTSHAAMKMPKLIGDNRAQVYAIMRRDGLFFDTLGPGSSNSHWVDVLAQSPKPGQMIKWHGSAVLHVTTQLPRGPRAMPNVIGMSRARVFQAMRRAQLFFKTVGPGKSSKRWQLALAQSPAPGTKVAWHSQVTIRVAITRPVVKKKVVKRTTEQAAAAVVSGTNFKVGIATWYNYVPGHCASPYLPKGTRITVRDLTTGKTITCIISDRENEGDDHVVDLSETQFAQLEPLAKGVISVKVSW
jgi:PASTA domain